MNDGVAIGAFDPFSMIPDAETARLYFEARRWPKGIVCPYNGCTENIVGRKGKRLGYRRCRACDSEFTVRTGTIFERSHVPLDKWAYAMCLVTARKSISSLQLSTEIGVTQKTAQLMLRRLGEACIENIDLQGERGMTKEALDCIADTVLTYDPTESNMLRAIAGSPDKPVQIGDVEIQCYVLEDETRVLSQRGMFSSLAIRRGGARTGDLDTRDSGAQLPRFFSQKWINPFLNNELVLALKSPIVFKASALTYGYPATLLPELCNAILEADRQGYTTPRQAPVVDQAQLLVRGLARLGIISLVDEATGYQHVREERALAHILERFIAKELQQWTRTFPMDFYRQLCRLRHWPNIYSVERPAAVANYTNSLIYQRLAPGVLDDLREKNPKVRGRRRYKHHQWLTSDVGHPRLKEHLHAVTTLMKSSLDWDDFMRRIDLALPVQTNQTVLHFEG